MNEDEAIALARAAARASIAEQTQYAYLQNITDDWQPHFWVVLAIRNAYRQGCRDQLQTQLPKD